MSTKLGLVLVMFRKGNKLRKKKGKRGIKRLVNGLVDFKKITIMVSKKCKTFMTTYKRNFSLFKSSYKKTQYLVSR